MQEWLVWGLPRPLASHLVYAGRKQQVDAEVSVRGAARRLHHAEEPVNLQPELVSAAQLAQPGQRISHEQQPVDQGDAVELKPEKLHLTIFIYTLLLRNHF